MISGSGVVSGECPGRFEIVLPFPTFPSCISVRCEGEELGNQAGNWPRPVQTRVLVWEAGGLRIAVRAVGHQRASELQRSCSPSSDFTFRLQENLEMGP